MEQQRMHVVQSIARARLVQFDGQPVAPWTTGQGQSLPPPLETPARSKRDRKPRTDPAETARLYAAIQQLLAQGQSSKTIAKTLGMDIKRVYTMKYRLGHGEVTVSTEVQQPTEVETAPRTPTPPACLLPSPEPVRTYVLDWAARLARAEFSEAPAGCLPRKRPKRLKTLTPSQIRRGTYNVLPAGSNHRGMDVNNSRNQLRSTPRRALGWPFD